MRTRLVVGLLILAGLAGCAASLDESHRVALGESLEHMASSLRVATHTGMSAAMTASGGVLAYYDENGNWNDEPCMICDGPSSDPSSDPTYPGNSTVYYGGPLDPSGGGTVWYTDPSFNGDAVNSPYYGPVYTQTNVPTYTDPNVYYTAPVTITSNSPLPYDEGPTFYGDTGATTYYGGPLDAGGAGTTYYDTGTTWYEDAFPGWGSAIVPLLPPMFRPTSYPTSYNYAYAQPTYVPPAYTPPAPQPDCTLTVTPATIDYGDSVTVSWVARNATRASFNGEGTVALAGSHVYNNLATSRTFGVTVTGQGGVNACYGTVTVLPKPVRPTCQISAHPSQIQPGQTASLAWATQNATFATLSNYGTVELVGGRTVAPSQTTNYLLSVTGQNGETGSCSTTVFVQ